MQLIIMKKLQLRLIYTLRCGVGRQHAGLVLNR